MWLVFPPDGKTPAGRSCHKHNGHYLLTWMLSRYTPTHRNQKLNRGWINRMHLELTWTDRCSVQCAPHERVLWPHLWDEVKVTASRTGTGLWALISSRLTAWFPVLLTADCWPADPGHGSGHKRIGSKKGWKLRTNDGVDDDAEVEEWSTWNSRENRIRI